MHGANRLASNSLLEGVVFGARAGRAMKYCAKEPFLPGRKRPKILFPEASESALRQLAWDACGIVRDAAGLQGASHALAADAGTEHTGATLAAYDARNIHIVASLIARCALGREESRGGHYRSDFPVSREEFRVPSVVRLDE